MTRKLSAWSKPGERPPCVGVWMTDYQNEFEPTYQYFDGAEFRVERATSDLAYLWRKVSSACTQSTIRFRGLTEKPE